MEVVDEDREGKAVKNKSVEVQHSTAVSRVVN